MRYPRFPTVEEFTHSVLSIGGLQIYSEGKLWLLEKGIMKVVKFPALILELTNITMHMLLFLLKSSFQLVHYFRNAPNAQ